MCLQFEAEVARRAKTRGGILALALVFLFVPMAARPQLAQMLFGRLWPLSQDSVSPKHSMAALPNLFFWAWERPEDLRFLESKKAGVAFLAKTIDVPAPSRGSQANEAGTLLVRPRLQPLRVAPGTPLMAVVRIETRGGRNQPSQIREVSQSSARSGFTTEQQQRIVDEIVDLQKFPNIRAIQIDFDATLSERASYASLLKAVRQNLPTSLPLSITALASWCIGDPWLEELPPGTIGEAVPMLFRMGRDTANVKAFLKTGEDFRAPACRESLGLSADEPFSKNLLLEAASHTASNNQSKRIYIFSQRAWTQPDAEAILKELYP